MWGIEQCGAMARRALIAALLALCLIGWIFGWIQTGHSDTVCEGQEIELHKEHDTPVVTLADNRRDSYQYRFVVVNSKTQDEYSFVIDRDLHRVYVCDVKVKGKVRWNASTGALILERCAEAYRVFIK